MFDSAIEENPNADGTSQADRFKTTLDPTRIKVDERSMADWLAFARDFADHINFFDVVNGELQVTEKWTNFFGEEVDLEEIAAFANDPDLASPQAALRNSRPHFALLLTFLQLLQQAQNHLNDLPRRHLDFYYQQVLGMTKRVGVPDHVNVLVDLNKRQTAALLPAGTRLDAGADSGGQPLVYRTTEELVVNRAQVERVSSLFVDRLILGVPEIHQIDQDEEPTAAYLNMLRTVFGEPNPGDPMPPYGGDTLDLPLLHRLRQTMNVIQTQMNMSFADFRQLMTIKRGRDQQAKGEWALINGYLTQAYQKKQGDRRLKLPMTDPAAFEVNFKSATGLGVIFKEGEEGLAHVENIDDLYDRLEAQEVRDFIEADLHFPNWRVFKAMMDIKRPLDNEWLIINNLLVAAGVAKGTLKVRSGEPVGVDLLYDQREPGRAREFAANFHRALGEDLFAGSVEENLERLITELNRLETTFYMSAGEFVDLLTAPIVAEDDAVTVQFFQDDPRLWEKIYALLNRAYRQKTYQSRRDDLADILVAGQADLPVAFKQMLSVAGDDFTLDQLGSSLTPNDLERLENVEKEIAASPSESLDRNNLPEKWVEVIELLERGLRPYLAEPVPEIIRWQNVYAAPDARAVQVQTALADDEGAGRWETFGRAGFVADEAPPAEIGWAISSPLLDLSGGSRKITLSLGFARRDDVDWAAIEALLKRDGEGETPYPFQAHISGAEGWVPVEIQATELTQERLNARLKWPANRFFAMEWMLELPAEADPVVPLPAEFGGISARPMVKITLRPVQNGSGTWITHYQPFEQVQMARLKVKVEVGGLTPTHLRNDGGPLDPAKPFLPFGPQAITGSRFYIGHPELIHKSLDNVAFFYDWKGLPPGTMQKYYEAYGVAANQKFNTAVHLLENRRPIELGKGLDLFGNPITEAMFGRPINMKGFTIPVIDLGEQGSGLIKTADTSLSENNLLSWPRLLRWELESPGFMHDVYPRLAAQKAMKMAADIANKVPDIDPDDYHVNPPYTPEMMWLTLSYTASTEFDLSEPIEPLKNHPIYHVHPFGFRPLPVTAGPVSFLPPFADAGELLIGLRHLEPPQTLALLFQVAEGTADPELPRQMLSWSYLSGDTWLTLENGQLLEDRTRGLINSGIVKFSLEPAAPNTLLDPELYWIRVTIPRHTDSVCDLIDLHTQAVLATFVDQGNAADHLSQPLAQESITDLVVPDRPIAGVRQPYTSFGGRMPERDSHFYTRISERLRHKGRALTIWDYEHLILDHFPDIYKAKCLPAGREAPGAVTVIVIPDIQNKLPADPFAPKASADLIADITTFLEARAPGSATILVKNPRYRPVKVRVGVRFREGADPGFYKQRLNDDINRYLSPWAFGESAEVTIGGRIYANSLVNFIDERPYIDYVAHINLFVADDQGETQPVIPQGEAGYFVATDRPDEVLVAHPHHDIDLIREEIFQEEKFSGINYMRIELDFIVG